MTAVAPLDDPSLPALRTASAASAARLRSLQASRASLRRRQSGASGSGAGSTTAQQPQRPDSANRILLQARRDEERDFRCQFFAAIGLAILGGFLCVAGVGLIAYGLPTPERIKRDYGDMSTDARLQAEVRLMLFSRVGGLVLGAGIFFIIVLLVIGLDYKMYLDRLKPVESAAAEMNRRLYANIMQNMRRAVDDGDSTSLSTSHRSSDRRSSMAAVGLVSNGSIGGSAILRVSGRPSTASGQHHAVGGGGGASRRGSLANLIPGAGGRRNSLPVKEQQRKQLSPAWKVNAAFDFSDEAVDRLKAGEQSGGSGGGVTSLEELFSRSSASSPRAPSFQMEGIAEESTAVSTAAAAGTAASGNATSTTADASTGTAGATIGTADATTETTVATAATEEAATSQASTVAQAPYGRSTPVGPPVLPAPADLADGAPESRPPKQTKAVPTTSGASATSSRPGSRPATASRRPSQQQPAQPTRRPQTVAPRRTSVARSVAAAATAAVASSRLKTAGAIQQQRQQQQQQQQGQSKRQVMTAKSQSRPQSRPPTAAASSEAAESRPDTAAMPFRDYTMVFDSDSEPGSSSSSSASDEELIYQQSGVQGDNVGGDGGTEGGGAEGGDPSESQNNLNRPGAEKTLREKLWREDTTDENASQDQSIVEEMTREIRHNPDLDQIGATAAEPGFSVHVHVHVHVSRNSSPNRQEQQQPPPPPASGQPHSNLKMLEFEHDGAI